MDIRKLQRAIVDGLEDVKGQNIAVFDTEHLSPLFERVIIASGTSNRQTKALASSVRDAVKHKGFGVMRTEGEDNGEWIIVDCGAAVVHVMQPAIRDYYHLEEIWGDKPVKMKIDNAPVRLVKASAPAKPAWCSERKGRGPAWFPAVKELWPGVFTVQVENHKAIAFRGFSLNILSMAPPLLRFLREARGAPSPVRWRRSKPGPRRDQLMRRTHGWIAIGGRHGMEEVL